MRKTKNVTQKKHHQNHSVIFSQVNSLQVELELYNQWFFLVPVKGGRWHIIPQHHDALPWKSSTTLQRWSLLGYVKIHPILQQWCSINS